MKVTAIKTKKVIVGDDLYKILDNYLPKKINEGSIVAITSKILSICEGSVVKVNEVDKDELVKKEADYYLPKEENKYNMFLTIKNGIMVATAGIDESNGNGYYVLWPRNPQESANEIRSYLIKGYGLKHVGVMITDSRTTPLLRGVSGMYIAHSGFLALKNYINKPDLFGRKLLVTRANFAEGIAGAVVAMMGEGNEMTPLVVIDDVPFIKFQRRNPTKKELANLRIKVEDDVFAPFLTAARWIKGGS